MRKLCLFSVLCGLLVLLCPLVASAADSSEMAGYASPEADNSLERLTGLLWREASQEQKEAFLLGVESAMIIEHYIAKEMRQRAAKRGKSLSASTLSPFEKGWAKVFSGVGSKEIARRIDAWYASNSDQAQRPVFEVIWYELIAPHYQPR